jgi:protein-arginine kinase activator protein McsA
MYNKIKGIFKGYFNLSTGTNKELKEKRLLICISCHKYYNNFCLKTRGGCGCYLPGKASEPDEHCPDNKW